MSFIKSFDSILDEQTKLLEQLHKKTELILNITKKVINSTSNPNHPEFPLYIVLKEIQEKNEHIKNVINFPFIFPRLDSIKDCQFEFDFYFKRMNGDVIINKMSIMDRIDQFYYTFMLRNGFNSLMGLRYKVIFFYEDKNGEQKFLDLKSKYTWFEIFGIDIPVINFFIDDNLTDKEKKEIAQDSRKYAITYHNVTTDMDDETLYLHYREWFMTHHTNSGERFFVENCLHLFDKNIQ